jgi:hypothetical protein
VVGWLMLVFVVVGIWKLGLLAVSMGVVLALLFSTYMPVRRR